MKIGLTLYMEQLINPSKSFTIKENVPVMQYFGLEDSSDIISETESKLIPNSNSKTGDINSINTDTMDVEVSLDTSSKKQVVEEDFSMQEIKVEKDNLMDNSQLGTLPLCRLCAQEIYDEELAYIHETITDDGLSLAEKINACLPITVTLKDTLPKQICSECLVNLESSYNFSSCVTSAEERLVNLQYRSKGDKLDCPMCCEGNMETTLIGDEDREEIGSDNTSFLKAGNDESNELASFSEKEERNEEYHEAYIAMYSEPILKQKRGRPRKNEIYTEMEMDSKSPLKCIHCDKIYKARKRLTEHIRRSHNKNLAGEIIFTSKFMCDTCGKVFGRKDHLNYHIKKFHNSSEEFKCNYCTYKAKFKWDLKKHILKCDVNNKNVNPKKFSCSYCKAGFKYKSSLQLHEKKLHGVQRRLRKKPINRKCPLCSFTSSSNTQNEINTHFSKVHELALKPEEHIFDNMDDFYKWKDDLEKRTYTFYAKHKQNANRGYYKCHRRGQFERTGTNRHLKLDGSCKINGHCPSDIKVKISKSGTVSVFYVPTHVGHTNNLKFSKLSKKEKQIIACQLLQKAPHEEIEKK